MSPRFTPRALGTVAAAFALAVGLAPAASGQPADLMGPPFPPPAPIPADAQYVGTQATVGLDDPGFWQLGSTPMRVVSHDPADSPAWCDGYWAVPGTRCWQVSPVGQAVELRRFSLFSDAWNGSSDPWGRAAYRAGYQIAIDNGWDYTSGGIFIPTGSGTTYSTMMPLGSPYNDADVWVAPGVIPGS